MYRKKQGKTEMLKEKNSTKKVLKILKNLCEIEKEELRKFNGQEEYLNFGDIV